MISEPELNVLQQFWQQFTGWEGAAMMLALLYVVLATREHLSCWYAAFISSAIYTLVFWDVSLLMDSALNLYYVAMAVYGWHQWRSGDSLHSARMITTWPPLAHVKALLLILMATLVSGFLLAKNTSAAWPYLDSFTTWASVLTTWMLARKVLENWLYWLVIDAVSMYLYVDRGLYPTVLLFALYTVMAVVGYWQWRKHQCRSLTQCSVAKVQLS